MNGDKILGKKIVIITAHPDDETFTAAGTIYLNNQMGGSTIVVCSTLGEKGSSHLDKQLSEAELGEVRKQELFSVLEFLGVLRNNIHTFSYPDTAVKKYCDILEEKVLPLVRAAQPDLIMSFDEYGLTGHEDHIAIAKVSSDIASELSIPLITFTLPPELLQEYPELFQKQQRHGKYSGSVKFKEPNVIIDIDKVVKEKALCVHKSQYGETDPLRGLPDSVSNCLLSKEYFFIAN